MKFYKKLSFGLAMVITASTVAPIQAQSGYMQVKGHGEYEQQISTDFQITTESAVEVTPKPEVEVTTGPAIEIDGGAVINGGFEEIGLDDGSGVWKGEKNPANWMGQGYGTSYKLADIRIDTEEKHTGNHAIKFEAKTNDDRGGIYQIFEVNPNTVYEVSFYAKTQNLKDYKHFGMQVHEIKNNGKFVTTDALKTLITDLSGSNDWAEYTHTFTTGGDTQKVKMQFAMGPSWKAPVGGVAWIDDVSWKQVDADVKSVELSQTNIVGFTEGTYQLLANVQPSYARNKSVTWMSSNPELVTVDEKGLLTFVKPGKATITVITNEGGFKDMCEVEVQEMGIIERISMPEKMTLMVDESTTIKPQIVPNVEGAPLQWTSEDESVAVVDDIGKVTAMGPGKAILRAAIGEVEATSELEVITKATNKVPNGGFEEVENDLPKNYHVDSGSASVTIDSSEAFTGNQSVKIEALEKTRVVIGNKNWIPAVDGVYGLDLGFKSLDAAGKIIIDIYQDKTDNVRLKETLEFEIPTTTSGWHQINEMFDGINVLRNVDFDIIFEGRGTLWLDNFKFYHATKIEALEIPDITIDLGTVDYTDLPKIDYGITSPQNPHDTRLVWQSSDSHIVEIKPNGILVPKKAGTATITGFTKDHSVKAKSTITVVGDTPVSSMIGVESLAIEGGGILEEGSGAKLQVEAWPANYTHLELEWKSSNPEVIEVYNGRIHAKAPGTATITAQDRYSNKSVSKTVTVTPREADKFYQVIQQWNLKIRKRHTVAEYDDMIDQYWPAMNKDVNRLYLWEDLKTDYRIGIDLGEVTKRLVVMATGTTLLDSKYYNNGALQADIADAMVWINKDYLGKENEKFRKSWHWNIGLPKDMADIYMLISDYMDAEEIKEGMKFVADEAVPEDIMDFSASNLVDAAKSRIAAHILFKNETEVTRYLEMSLKTLDFIKSGSGFYEDGSFVEHENIAYTGSYGTVLLNGLGDMVDIFGGTSFDIGNHPLMINLYEILENSYLPLMSYGSFMDNTRGRAISRPGDGDHGEGHVAVSAIIKAGYAAPEPYRTRLLSEAKRIVLADKEHFEEMVNFYVRPNVDKLMADDSILAAESYVYSHEFGAMNRTVHHRESYGLGISKSSKRIATFENLNGENKKGWNTGYGMTNIYNTDVSQYQEGYWATINPYRLPGTTADTGVRASDNPQYGDGEGTTKNNWAGGVTLNETFGTSGMNLQTIRKAGSTLIANKSWFMFDDEIIAFGSNINSKDDRSAETIVENRKIDLLGTNKLTLNGQEHSVPLGDEKIVQDVKWAHLQGRVEGADIGYYFPEATDLAVLKETRTGNYSEINAGRNEVHTNTFATMVIDHGKAPVNQKYVYAMVPGASVKDMETYTNTPRFQVVANENTLHAVRHLEHDILASNFYSTSEQEVEYLRVDGEGAVIIRENENSLEIAISDPTMERDQVVVDLLGKSYTQILSASIGMTISQTPEGVRLVVDTKNSLSKSFEATLQTADVQSDQVTRPTATPGSGTYKEVQMVTLGVETENAEIYYTLNSDELLTAVNISNAKQYSGAIEIKGNTKLQAIAIGEGKIPSNVATFNYIIQEETVKPDESTSGGGSSSSSSSNSDKEKVVPEQLTVDQLQKQVKETVLRLGREWSQLQVSPELKEHISQKHWGYETVGRMVTLGVVDLTEEKFDLTHKVTRSEAVQLIGRLFQLEGNKEQDLYEDVDQDAEYVKYLEVMTELGVIAGIGKGEFSPEATLTREQMAAILVSLLEVTVGTEIEITIETPFKDKDTSAWAVESIQKAYNAGLIKGVNKTTFLPQKEVSLAEALAMLERSVITMIQKKQE